MARSLMYDPGTMQARSQWISGLTEICNKMSGVLDMEVSTFTNLTLLEVAISTTDRGRIYQAPLGNKLWLQQPPPVIMKNGVEIYTEYDGFEIDYLGGSIAFNPGYECLPEDVITASASYIIGDSKTIGSIIQELNSLKVKTDGYQGSFASLNDLGTAIPTGKEGNFAVVQENEAVYIWSVAENYWVNSDKVVDLSDYITSEQIETLLAGKENSIPEADSNNFYYAGKKTWVNIFDTILGTVLSGLVTTDSSKIAGTDTLLSALGKLQAQISANVHSIYGTSQPTTALKGEIGQDYVDTSSGKKYHLVRIVGIDYIWEQYVSESQLNELDATLTKEIDDTDSSLRKYVDNSIQDSIYRSWKASY